MNEVGQVISSDKGCFQWIIDHFFSHTILNNGSEQLISPNFNFSGYLCNLRIRFRDTGLLGLYFTFHKEETFDEETSEDDVSEEETSEEESSADSEWMDRILAKFPDEETSGEETSEEETSEEETSEEETSEEETSEETTLYVRLGMTTGYRGKTETRSGEVSISDDFSVDWMQCSEMLERGCEILPNGRLTVSCEIWRLHREESASVPSTEQHPNAGEEKAIVENKTSEWDSYEKESTIIDLKVVRKLQKDLYSLLTTGEDSDVTIKVQGKEFLAHRYILRARSPVFRSMFSHEMVEKQSGVVVIEDCDPVTFPDFLKCVYTGSTRHICDENVYHLYTASDKYGIDELKEECAEFMKNNLSVDRFCDTITLALQHNEKELVGFATAFFCEKAIEITKTAKWQVFLHENTTAGNELFIKFLSREKIVKREKKFKK